jgi:hypothetical protein
MRTLQLDYRRRRGPRLAAYVLAAFAVAFAADGAVHYRALERDLALKEARLAGRMHLRKQNPAPSISRPVNPEEYAFARDTVRRLGTPWEALFQALEASQIDRVALLSIEPDVENRAVSISGEARDYLAVLTYVAQLGDQGALSRVHLVRHENRRGGPRPLAFTVSASWKEDR